MNRWAWVESVAAVVLPDACVACDEVLHEHEAARGFCETCWPTVHVLSDPRCARCSEPGVFSRWCPRCERTEPQFSSAWAAFEHEGAVARAISRFKFEDRSDLSRPLGAMLCRRALAIKPAWHELVLSVPLHESRFRERRYDQAALLARELARRLRLRFEPGWLSRRRATSPQVGSSETARTENVRDAFACAPHVRDTCVLLIDDVFTTGATAREATQTLLDAGASSVVVLTLARARRESLEASQDSLNQL